MVVKSKTAKGVCKICKMQIRRKTQAEFIRAMGKHYHKMHPEVMKRRIKKGMKNSSKGLGRNPFDWQSILAGVFPPAALGTAVQKYKGMSAGERQLLKRTVRATTTPLGAEAQAVATIILQAFDMLATGQIQS